MSQHFSLLVLPFHRKCTVHSYYKYNTVLCTLGLGAVTPVVII